MKINMKQDTWLLKISIYIYHGFQSSCKQKYLIISTCMWAINIHTNLFRNTWNQMHTALNVWITTKIETLSLNLAPIWRSEKPDFGKLTVNCLLLQRSRIHNTKHTRLYLWMLSQPISPGVLDLGTERTFYPYLAQAYTWSLFPV